jgi:glycosyltransferase involved in cell wall biosynthesis
MGNTPLVSIICSAYNHEDYIAEALDGFVMQKTSFPFEIIVHDDASTDKTASIVKDYERKFPELFSNIYQRENQFSKAIGSITKLTYTVAKGKYIALCEGDDYWIDENKLQKQVDFLESNADYCICFHRVYELQDQILALSDFNTSEKEESYTIEDLSKGNIIHTPSVIFRNRLIEKFPDWFLHSPINDYVLHMLNARHGKIKYLPEPMSVYRKHNQGIWSSQTRLQHDGNMVRVLSFLMQENFPREVMDNLTAAKKKYINGYLHELLEVDIDKFIEKLHFFSAEDTSIANEWLYSHFPEYLKKLKNSKTYKWAVRLRKVKEKFMAKL